MRKICIVTSTRAEYGLLKPLIAQIENDQALELQLIVTGTHLSEEFGETYKDIEKDFAITQKVPMQLTYDTALGTSTSMAKLQISMSEALSECKPDIVVILGDRYEIMAVAIASLMLTIPIAHIHGGETTEGAIDEAIRHSITKMSHLHFPATQEYKKRIIQLGENPQRVFNVGALGVENILTLKLLDKQEFEKSINFKLNKKNLLVTFHPETLSSQTTKEQFSELLEALHPLQETNIIFTKSNADKDAKIINSMIDTFVSKHTNAIVFNSLGQLRYLSALQYVDAVVGNSSSGIIEVPSFNIATINIGNRQKGRIQAKSIINVTCTMDTIRSSLEYVYTQEFQNILKTNKNPYTSKNTSSKIKEILKKTSLEDILKKSFYNINF